VAAAFISPSGTGVKAVFRVAGDLGDHVNSFAAVRAYLQDSYGIEAEFDTQCKNPERLCYVSYDPEAFLAENPEPLTVTQDSVTQVLKYSGTQNSDECKRVGAPAKNSKTDPSLSNKDPKDQSLSNRATVLENIQHEQRVKTAMEANREGSTWLYERLVEARFPAAPGKRNLILTEMVPFLYRAVSECVVLTFSATYYESNRSIFNDPLDQHMNETNKMIKSVAETYAQDLSEEERKIYNALSEEARPAFRICRDLAMLEADERRAPPIFFLSYNQLATRLGLRHNMQAMRILDQLVRPGLVTPVTKGDRPQAGVRRGKAGSWRWNL
jgi:hypothetical protein